MSDRHGSSHDEGELSDESHKRSNRASSSEDAKANRSNKETKMRESILSRLSKRKMSDSDDDTTEHRFSIQPKEAHRDTRAFQMSHPGMNTYIAVVENESRARTRFNQINRMIQPCGPPPEKNPLDDI
uniref:Uncharacterized protein n=1 Tax=Caenorhabditis japonica TaxID=281687 RepID=A0A8R1IJR9_CAEJA